ncbi:MAG TPA: hypothetical protein VGG18_16125, partial [Granulicella sp.]
MRTRTFTLARAYVLLCCSLPVFGQVAPNNTSIHTSEAAKDTDDPIAIVEVGAATNWNFTGGA